jgi:hypothetical protein
MSWSSLRIANKDLAPGELLEAFSIGRPPDQKWNLHRHDTEQVSSHEQVAYFRQLMTMCVYSVYRC